MTADILSSIDSALADYATSKDAMRWVPERVICDGGGLWPERWSLRRHGTYYVRTTATFSPEDIAEVSRAVITIFTQVAEDFQRMGQVMAKAMFPIWRLSQTWAHDMHRSGHPRWHIRCCPRCNPAGNPRPLCINGQDYHRRLNARRRRKRG